MAVAIATIGAALAVGVGVAGPAYADAGFTATITNVPLTTLSTEIDFQGTMPAGSTVTFAGVNVAGSLASCIDTGGVNWACTYSLTAGFSSGNYSAQFVVQNADNTVTTQVLSFVIFPSTDVGSATPDSPIVGYQFSPDAVTVTGTPTGNGNAVASQILTPVYYGYTAAVSCPASGDGIGGVYPLGDPTVGSETCSDSGLSDGSPVVATTQQGIEAVPDPPTVSSDGSYGLFYIPQNSIDSNAGFELGYSSDTTTRIVNVSGFVSDGTFADGGAVVVLDSNGGILCTTTTVQSTEYDPILDNDVDQWTCPTSVLGYGTHTLTASIEDNGEVGSGGVDEYLTGPYGAGVPYGYYVHGALSSSSIVGSVTFAAPSAPGTPGNDAGGDTTPTWTFSVTGDLEPGGTITVSGAGLPAGTSVDTVLHSVPTDLGTVVAAGDGTFTNTVTIPADEPVGNHTIIVTASGPGLVTTTQQQAITLTGLPSSTSGGTTTSTLPTTAHGSGLNANGTGTAIQPNILTRALTPIADVALHPSKIVSAIEIGLVLLLLAVLPAHLLNATIAEQSDRFERRFKRFPKRPRWLTALVQWFTSAPVAAGIVVTLVTAILFGFADPRFGWTLASLRLILACGIALFLVGYVANWLTSVIARNQWHITVLVSTRPYGLILTVVGVVISRLLHFSPGFLIGLILGLTIQGKSAVGFAWRTVVTRTCIVLAMSIAAWIGYSTLTLGGNEGGSFGSALVVETLVAITTEGIVALLVELLPLRFLEGERVYAHSRVLWGILYFLTLVVFVLGVIPWEGNWDALGSSLWIWIAVLLGFAVVCVAVYIYFRRFAPPLEEDAGSEEVALGETVAGDRS